MNKLNLKLIECTGGVFAEASIIYNNYIMYVPTYIIYIEYIYNNL